jgi:hypothetical protein
LNDESLEAVAGGGIKDAVALGLAGAVYGGGTGAVAGPVGAVGGGIIGGLLGFAGGMLTRD